MGEHEIAKAMIADIPPERARSAPLTPSQAPAIAGFRRPVPPAGEKFRELPNVYRCRCALEPLQ